VARLPEGFSHFVASMTAPVASGWSGCTAPRADAYGLTRFACQTAVEKEIKEKTAKTF